MASHESTEVHLPVVESLRSGGHVGETLTLRQDWDELQCLMRQKWQVERGSTTPIPREPLLFGDDETLDELFGFLCKYFFDGELFNIVDYDWEDMEDINQSHGRTGYTSNPSEIEMFITRPPSTEGGFYTGEDAIEIISTVLHEMCHAYVQTNVCRCTDCEAVPERLGETEHGNVWRYLAGLAEKEVEWLFGHLGKWDLGLQVAFDEELDFDYLDEDNDGGT
ncbi:MAG: hypothetical protein Q9181_002982 [Wetmoreana brouardii]